MVNGRPIPNVTIIPNPEKIKALNDLKAKLKLCDKCTGMEIFAPIIKEIETGTEIEELYNEYERLAKLPPIIKSETIREFIDDLPRDIGWESETIKWPETNPAVTAKLNEILKLMPACGVCGFSGKNLTTGLIKNKITEIDAGNKLNYYNKIPELFENTKYDAKKALRAVLDGCGSACPPNVKQSVNASGVYSTAETAARNAASGASSAGNDVVDAVGSLVP